MLKNRITKHESRKPSPKYAGPSVPVENLSDKLLVRSHAGERVEIADEREDAKVRREPNEKYLVILRIRSIFWRNGDNA